MREFIRQFFRSSCAVHIARSTLIQSTSVMVTHQQPVMPRQGNKLIFADQLRVLACLSVLAVHWAGIYWLGRDVVASRIFAPPLEGPHGSIFGLLQTVPINFGPFGVGLFFLISGFVIPFSLAATNPPRFLIARALRIYPTYIVCLVTGLFFTYLSAAYWGRDFGWPVSTVLANLSLYKGIGTESIDLVNWSLAVELKFYLAAALLSWWIRSARVLPVLALCASIALLARFISADFVYLPFMFIGTMFSYHLRSKISSAQLLAASAFLFALFVASQAQGVLKEQIPDVPKNYLYALAVFSLAYRMRARFRPIKPIDWLASISYPVYALHSITGYASIRFLTDQGVSYYLALAVTTAFVGLLAYVIHRGVELPTMAFGKKVARGAIRNDLQLKSVAD
jgi:peptidoglycan/LPS O-acetylase OafA/YrhL